MDHSLNVLKFLITNKNVTKTMLTDLVQLISTAGFEDSSDDATYEARAAYIQGLLHDSTAEIEGFTSAE